VKAHTTFVLVCCVLPYAACESLRGAEPAPAATSAPPRVHYLDTTLENASPLWWETAADGTVQINFVYDQERASPNRANGHWLFRIEGEPDTDLTLDLGPFGNVWNGTLSKPIPEATIAFLSDDGQQWRVVPAEPAEPYRLRLRVHLNSSSLYVARLEPYRISDLERFKSEIARHPAVEITVIGHTVERRELELIRVGRPQAPHRVFLRARAHPWEPGGNWVIEGLVRRLLDNDEHAQRCLDRYCLYLLPMANKDGVARGRTRFNMRGMDLNRKWDTPADPTLAPENAAIERWIESTIAQQCPPDLAIDFHNDASGRLHISRPDEATGDTAAYLQRMEQFERLLRAGSWFTEGSTSSSFRNPGTIGEGLLARYGITACIHELNANWIEGLQDYPTAANWKKYGAQLSDVLFKYFEPVEH